MRPGRARAYGYGHVPRARVGRAASSARSHRPCYGRAALGALLVALVEHQELVRAHVAAGQGIGIIGPADGEDRDHCGIAQTKVQSVCVLRTERVSSYDLPSGCLTVVVERHADADR